jgi:hypothetical protein
VSPAARPGRPPAVDERRPGDRARLQGLPLDDGRSRRRQSLSGTPLRRQLSGQLVLHGLGLPQLLVHHPQLSPVLLQRLGLLVGLTLIVTAAGCDGRVDPETDLGEAILEFAPVVYLHPSDPYRPASVQSYLQSSALMDGNGQVLAEPVTSQDLVDHNGSDRYLEVTDPDILQGHPLTEDGQVQAGMYVNVREGGSYTDIQYWMFYPSNGPLTFRTGIFCNLSTQRRNYEWPDLGRHQGDWEHVTVRVSNDYDRILNVFYPGEGRWLVPGQYQTSGGHPVVYSAFSSHTPYASEQTRSILDLVEPDDVPAISPIRWIKLVETTSTSDHLNVYEQPDPHFNSVVWRPHENNDLYMLNEDNDFEEQPWAGFDGRWGPEIDNSTLQTPPSMPCSAHTLIRDNVSDDDVPDFIKTGRGDVSPPNQSAWDRDTPSRPYIQAEAVGGPHGDPFSDFDAIPEGARVSEVGIRAGNRVDQVSIAYDDGTRFEHGGSGGTANVLELAPDEYVHEAYACWAQHSGRTRIFYLELRTNLAQVISGGSQTDDCQFFGAPEGMQIGGFHGRSGAEIDLLGMIYTPVGDGMAPVTEYPLVRNRESGLCLDIDGGQMSNGRNVLQWTCTGSANQRWIVDEAAGEIRSLKDPSFCLDNMGDVHDGGRIGIWECNDGINQQFTVDGNAIRQGADPNLVLDGAGVEPGDDVISWSDWGGHNQRWDLLTGPAAQPEYANLVNQEAGRCLDVEGGVMADGTNVFVWDCHGGVNQEWAHDAGTGQLHSRVNPNYCLDNSGVPAEGGNLQIQRCEDGNPDQEFDYVQGFLRNRANPDVVVGVDGTGNGANAVNQVFSNANSQVWLRADD